MSCAAAGSRVRRVQDRRGQVGGMPACQDLGMLTVGAMPSVFMLARPLQQLLPGLRDSAEHHRVTFLDEHLYVCEHQACSLSAFQLLYRAQHSKA